MKRLVALLRGINVGGRNRLPMKDLVGVLEALGARDVRTHAQSGNVVFRHSSRGHAALAKKIAAGVEKAHGFRPHVLVLDVGALEHAAESNPFPAAEDDPKSLHLGFLDAKPAKPDRARLESLKTASESFRLAGDVYYLHAPDGIARSKLAAGAEKALGVPMTFRNWRTVSKLLEMAREG